MYEEKKTLTCYKVNPGTQPQSDCTQVFWRASEEILMLYFEHKNKVNVLRSIYQDITKSFNIFCCDIYRKKKCIY